MARRLPCCVPCSSVVHVSSGVRAHTRSAGAELVAAAIVVPLAFFPLWECRVFAHVTLPQPKRLLLRLVLLPLGLLLGAHARLVLRLLALDDEQHDLKHAGWGCMLRTAQSLLATSLGRVGDPAHTSLPPFPPTTPATFAAHARLLSWFLDAPAAPFGVHRMALAGKAAGKDVGMWFGPSAAGAVRMLVDAFPACGMGVSVATDGTLYETEVYAASHSPAALAALQHLNASTSAHGHGSSHGHSSHGHPSHGHGGKEARDGKGGKPETRAWGDRPVLVLLGIRLGLDGVNPVYYETIKVRAVVLVSFLEARGEEEWAVTWRVRLY